MTDLSPAAQAIWNAYLDNTEWEVTQCELKAVAAALRATANNSVFADVSISETVAVVRVDTLLAIAAELEDQQ